MEKYLSIQTVNRETKEVGHSDNFESVKVEEIQGIVWGKFYSDSEFKNALSLFPKSYNPYVSHGFDDLPNGEFDFSKPYKSVGFRFNTIHMNTTTGTTNESAEKRRLKVIAKIKDFARDL